jgi:hypothetical protein
MTLQIVDFILNPSVTFNFVNQTLSQISVGLLNSNYQTTYQQDGSTCFIQIQTLVNASVITPQMNDLILLITSNTLVNNSYPTEDFTRWTFLNANQFNQMPKIGVNFAYAYRDTTSGGLSNLGPPVEIGPLQYPSRYLVSAALPSILPFGFNLELYRTVDGGSSFLYDQTFVLLSGSNYLAIYGTPDSGLNDQLIGPIDSENNPPPSGLRNVVSHTGRLFGIVGNRVYFSGGPDTTNGNGDESWAPGNSFLFPGNVTDIKSTDYGLVVALSDDLHVITGVDSSSYYAKPWIAGYGISAATAWTYEKQSLYIYTTKQQLHSLNDGNMTEIGFPIGDQLATLFPAATTSVTFHRSTSNDTALYISNGSGSTPSIFRYDPTKRAWSPRHQPISFSTGRVKSLETSTGIQSLLNSTGSGVFVRDLTVFSDNNVPYDAFATVGVMSLAPLGSQVSLNNLGFYFKATGTLPKVSVLLNETVASTAAPFLQLFNPQNDPPDAPASVSIWAKRFYVESTISPFRTGTRLINLASVRVDFGTDIVQNEMYTMVLRSGI